MITQNVSTNISKRRKNNNSTLDYEVSIEQIVNKIKTRIRLAKKKKITIDKFCTILKENNIKCTENYIQYLENNKNIENIEKLPKQIKKIFPEFTWRMIDIYHDYYTKKDCIQALDNIYKSNEDYYDNFEDHEELLQTLCKIDKKIPNINYMTLEKYYGGDISEFPCFN